MSETYFLTGALGCIGAWVAKEIVAQGGTPHCFDLGEDRRRLEQIMDGDELTRVRFQRGDVTDYGAVRTAVAESGATRILHLAGLQVPFCKADPALGARVNVLGTIHLFQAARELGLERVVYASSAAVYGPPENGEGPPNEGAACEPATHYGVYKRANEGNARVYWNDDGLSSVGLRPLTVYGVGRDQGLTSGPTLAMKAAVLGRRYTIPFRGRTDFNWVRDTAATFVACADKAPEGAHVFNLHGESVTVERILELLTEIEPGARDTIDCDGPEIPIPPELDGSALDAAIPGLPRTPIEEGMRRTVERFSELAEAGRLDTRELDA